MKFFFRSLIFFFLLTSVSNSNENIRFIDINLIVNNSKVGKSLNEIIIKKNNEITSELQNLKNELDKKKEKILSQKNVLKKDEYNQLIKNYDIEAKKFNEIRKNKMNDFNNFRINSQKKF